MGTAKAKAMAMAVEMMVEMAKAMPMRIGRPLR
jgi:hypothetical protein